MEGIRNNQTIFSSNFHCILLLLLIQTNLKFPNCLYFNPITLVEMLKNTIYVETILFITLLLENFSIVKILLEGQQHPFVAIRMNYVESYDILDHRS
jgi:hypothetical protein